MYQELLDIVRSSDEPDDTSASSDATRPESKAHSYAANMPVVAEESETEYPSFSMKKKGPSKELKRGDSEFD